MQTFIHKDKQELGRAAAKEGIDAIGMAVERKGRATIVLATGASQFSMLEALTGVGIDWSTVTVFHLDEYVGISPEHPASFRAYLRERFVDRVGPLGAFVAVDGSADDIDAEVARLNARLSAEEVDVCFAGIGENCHLAFNDPPADFETEAPYLVVNLDEACRRQQMGEGWFETLEDVPERAISMSVRQILKSAKIVVSVPDARKAQAVTHVVEGAVTNMHPASILQEHAACSLHLDPESASLLRRGEE